MWSEAQREGKRSITYPSITNQYITNDNYWHLLAVLLALATAIFHHFSCFTQKPRNNDSSVSDRRNNQEKLFLHSKVTNDYYVLKFNIFPLSATFRFSTSYTDHLILYKKYTYKRHSSWSWRLVIHLCHIFLRLPFQRLKHSEHVKG